MNYYGNNNGYYMNPMQYGQMQAPQIPMYTVPSYTQQLQPQQQIQEEIDTIWVQGPEGGKAYPVAPNKTVLMQDSNGEYIYKKRADKDGRPIEFGIYKKVSDSTEKEVSSEATSTKVEYATKDDLQKLNNEIAEIRDTILDIQTTPDTPKRTRRTNQ